MGRKGGGKQRRECRHRAVHQSGQAWLDILQHEHSPSGLVFGGADVRLENLVGQLRCELLVASLGFGKIAEQPPYTDIVGSLGRLDVEALGLELHRADFLADGVERQVLGEPDRVAAQEPLDVLAPYRG